MSAGDIEAAGHLSDRVVMLSDGPGAALNEVTVNMPRHRNRTDETFTEVKAEIRTYFEEAIDCVGPPVQSGLSPQGRYAQWNPAAYW